jgi:PST family polysaccharide transporter
MRELGSRARAWGTVGDLVDATLVKNTVSLYAIQFANYLLPLITIPYLVRVLGPVNYGAVAFAQSLIGYFMVFVDYGFDLSATRKISVHRQDPATVSQIAVNTWAAKGLLCVLGFLILVVITLLIPQVREIWRLVFVLYGLVVGNVLFPVWLFQGMERMVAISIINLGMRLLVVIGMLFAVRRPEDYVVYAALLSAGGFIAGGVGLVIGVHTFSATVHEYDLE